MSYQLTMQKDIKKVFRFKDVKDQRALALIISIMEKVAQWNAFCFKVQEVKIELLYLRFTPFVLEPSRYSLGVKPKAFAQFISLFFTWTGVILE